MLWRCGVCIAMTSKAYSTYITIRFKVMSSTEPVAKDIGNALERHRARLEASLEKLRKALRQWQTYSAEYEGLKEELQELPADASRESMVTSPSP